MDERAPTTRCRCSCFHGNLVTAGWWRYVAEALPGRRPGDRAGPARLRPDRVEADRRHPRTRRHGRRRPVAARRARPGRRGTVNAAGWSMGGGVLWQYMLSYPDDLASLTMIAPISPYGFGGARDATAGRAYDDHAGSGGGTAAPDFVRRLAAGDRSEEDPRPARVSSCATSSGRASNAVNVDEEFLLDEVAAHPRGRRLLPGRPPLSSNWPGVGPGARGVLNAMSPKYYNATGIVDLPRKPPITWLRGGQDQVISDTSVLRPRLPRTARRGPGLAGRGGDPPQPMAAQIRALLDAYRNERRGGRGDHAGGRRPRHAGGSAGQGRRDDRRAARPLIVRVENHPARPRCAPG